MSIDTSKVATTNSTAATASRPNRAGAIAEWADREMKSPGGGKALLFEQPTVEGAVLKIPLAINTMGSEKRMALALQVESVADLAQVVVGEPQIVVENGVVGVRLQEPETAVAGALGEAGAQLALEVDGAQRRAAVLAVVVVGGVVDAALGARTGCGRVHHAEHVRSVPGPGASPAQG